MTDNIIEIKNVLHRYKGAETESLKDVSIYVKKGETLLLCGASGSGKTSLIRLINGLIPHYYQGEVSGEVRVKDLDVSQIELYELAGIVGTVFQNPRSQFFSVDTDGEIVFGPENVGLDPKEILERKETIVHEMHIEKLLGRSLFELSGGEKQRIACASVAALLPEIILLDEPSSNLDWNSIERLGEIIRNWKEQGKTIIISEHRLWYLKDLVDRVIYMENGKIEREWSGDTFCRYEKTETNALKLRPLIVNEHFTKVFSGQTDDVQDTETNAEDGIVLKDFYFSYHQKPYVLRKKKFSKSDGDLLNLCIPEMVLPKGKVFAVIGKNGTGKSTFLKLLSAW